MEPEKCNSSLCMSEDEDMPHQRNRFCRSGDMQMWALIYLVFTIWALYLAMRIKEKEHRVLHMTLALIAGPVYVFGYYLSQISA